MKFTVSMKDPDTLTDAIREAVKADASALPLDDDEAEAVVDLRTDKVNDLCRKWFKWGEYLTVEIDTVAGTCIVMEAKS